MKTFRQYNESIRDEMRPISTEVLTDKLGGLTYDKLKNYILNSLWNNDRETLDLLVKYSDISVLDKYDKVDILKTAIGKEHMGVIKWVLDSGVPSDLLELLHEYSEKGHRVRVSKLIDSYIKLDEGIRVKMTPVDSGKLSKLIDYFERLSRKRWGGKDEMIDIIINNFTVDDIQTKMDEFIDPMDMMVWTSDKGNYGQVYTHDKVEVLNKEQLLELFHRLMGVNESIRSKMIGKSKSDVVKSLVELKTKDVYQQMEAIDLYDLPKEYYPSDEEIKAYIDSIRGNKHFSKKYEISEFVRNTMVNRFNEYFEGLKWMLIQGFEDYTIRLIDMDSVDLDEDFIGIGEYTYIDVTFSFEKNSIRLYYYNFDTKEELKKEIKTRPDMLAHYSELYDVTFEVVNDFIDEIKSK